MRNRTRHGYRSHCSETRYGRQGHHRETPYGHQTHRPAVPHASRCRGPTTPCWTRHPRSRSPPTPYRNPPQMRTHRNPTPATAHQDPARTTPARFARVPQPQPRKSPSRSTPTHPYRRSVAQPPPACALSRGRPKQASGPANRRSSAYLASLAHSTHPTHPNYPTHQACWAHPTGSPRPVHPTRPACPTCPPHPASPAYPKPDQPSNRNPKQHPHPASPAHPKPDQPSNRNPKHHPKPGPRQNPKQDPKFPRRQAPKRNPRRNPRRPLPHPTPPPPKSPTYPAFPQNQNAVGPNPRPLRQGNQHQWNRSGQSRHRTSATPPSSSCSPNPSRSPGPWNSPHSSTPSIPAGGPVAASPAIRGRVALPCSCTPRFLVPGPASVRMRAASVLCGAGPVPPFARIRTGVHPASPGTYTNTKSSRARIPAAADRHPGRGRTTGGVSSVRARHSTG